MRRQVIYIDDDGYPLETYMMDVEFDESGQPILEDWLVLPHGPEDVFYKPRWDGDKWVESLSQEEIAIAQEQNKPPPSEIDILKEENRMLREASRINALAIMELTELILGGT